MIKIGNEQIIDLFDQAINIRKLTCGICFCVVIAPLQCSNIKCCAIYCSECIKNTIINEYICPFCRLEVEFINVDHSTNFILNNLKIYCNHLKCTSLYKVDQFIRHYKEKEHVEDRDRCETCKLTKDLIWCNECNFISCGECNFMLYCGICEINICLKCNKGYYNKHVNCKLVNCMKESCGSKGDIITKCCNANMCKNDTEYCDSCEDYYCSTFPCRDITHTCDDLEYDILDTKCDKHDKIMECKKCYPQCCFQSRSGLYDCSKCKAKLCASSFCHQKCKTCAQIYCRECIIQCKICKNYTCKDCAIKCDSCEFTNPNSYSCKPCSLPSLKHCANRTCKKNLCINCWKVCNSCSIIQCSEHSIKCTGCEDSVCDKHVYYCNDCDTSYSKGKLCLRYCTYKCDNCSNISTSYCDRQQHTIVHNLKCRHNICDQCVRKCSSCYDVKQQNHYCPICIFSFYEKKILYCKFCKQDYCSNCFKYCRRCEEYYCLFNKCNNCSKTIHKCTNCLLYKSRVNCNLCKLESFKVCNKCNEVLLCSLYCYLEFTKKTEHLCNMFYCLKCLQLKEENGLLPKDNNDSFEESNWLDASSYSRCDYSDFSIGGSLHNRRYRHDDKVRVGCNESCTCNIF
jgi:hypothetical protein